MNGIAEVVIIGSGVIGVALAYNLAKKGIENIVLCQKNHINSNENGKYLTSITAQFENNIECVLARESINIYKNINQILDINDKCDFEQNGCIKVTSKKEDVKRFKDNIELQNKLDIKSELLMPEEIKEIAPYLNIENIVSGTFGSFDGNINTSQAINVYTKAAIGLGVEILNYTKVIEVETMCGEVRKVVTSKGEIYTNKIVSIESNDFKKINNNFNIEMPIVKQGYQLLTTEPIKQKIKSTIFSISNNIKIDQNYNGSLNIIGYEDGIEYYYLKDIWDKVNELLLIDKGVKIIRQRSSTYNKTIENKLILDEHPEVKGYYIIAGFKEHEFSFAPMIGFLMADYIVEETTAIDISNFKFESSNSK